MIPTIGRNSLSRAVNSVLDQSFSLREFEVVIVNDSGKSLANEEWQHSKQVRVINTNQRERSMARNAGAAVSRGEYIWFLDDDDWVLPNALNELKTLASQSDGASWLYGGIHVVDKSGSNLAERNAGVSGNCFAQIMGGIWVPIQSSIVKVESFFAVGGFSPFIIGTEDQDLCRKIAMIGEFANTEAAVACLFRGSQWDTSTDYIRAPEDTRRSRDEVLDEPGAYSRMHSSAGNAYWLGRIVRVYMSTVNLNLQQRRIFKAFGRAVFAGISALHAGGALFSRRFWDGLRADHVSGSLHFIMIDLEKNADKKRQ